MSRLQSQTQVMQIEYANMQSTCIWQVLITAAERASSASAHVVTEERIQGSLAGRTPLSALWLSCRWVSFCQLIAHVAGRDDRIALLLKFRRCSCWKLVLSAHAATNQRFVNHTGSIALMRVKQAEGVC